MKKKKTSDLKIVFYKENKAFSIPHSLTLSITIIILFNIQQNNIDCPEFFGHYVL